MVENEEITGTMRAEGENDPVSEFIGISTFYLWCQGKVAGTFLMVQVQYNTNGDCHSQQSINGHNNSVRLLTAELTQIDPPMQQTIESVIRCNNYEANQAELCH